MRTYIFLLVLLLLRLLLFVLLLQHGQCFWHFLQIHKQVRIHPKELTIYGQTVRRGDHRKRRKGKRKGLSERGRPANEKPDPELQGFCRRSGAKMGAAAAARVSLEERGFCPPSPRGKPWTILQVETREPHARLSNQTWRVGHHHQSHSSPGAATPLLHPVPSFPHLLATPKPARLVCSKSYCGGGSEARKGQQRPWQCCKRALTHICNTFSQQHHQ